MDSKWKLFVGDEVFKFNEETGEVWIMERDPDDDDNKLAWIKIVEKKEEK